MKKILFLLVILLLFFGCSKNKVEQASEDTIKTQIKRDIEKYKQEPPQKKNNNYGIVIGTTADEVLAIRGKALETKVVGKDDTGLIVEWKFSDAIYTLKRTSFNSPYKVAIIK